MIFAAKLMLLAVMSFGVAVAQDVVAVVDPAVSQAAAVGQFDDTQQSDRDLRAYASARDGLTQLFWLAVPTAAFLLFAGDVTRHVAARR